MDRFDNKFFNKEEKAPHKPHPDKPEHPVHPEHPEHPTHPEKPEHPNRITVLVNGEEKMLPPHTEQLSYEEIVKLAYGTLPTNPNTIYTVAYSTITDITDKLRCQKIGIVGLGGTGSYVLDQVAKTPVSEIHLYDGDIFCQHNAFRAPGAPCKELLEESRRKTDYFAEVYGHMHKGIVSHPVFVTEANTHELTSLDFVFLCMDTGEHKRVIINTLMEHNIAFIDTGIDISEHNRELLGTARTTSVCFGDTVSDMDVQVVEENISFEPVTDADLYRSNIQTAELNAFCALMAVIKWKKHCGFYQDLCPYQNRVYNTNDGEFK